MIFTPRFFIEEMSQFSDSIVGENAKHIIKSLRMKPGEKLTVSDSRGMDYYCEIINISDNQVFIKVLYSQLSDLEPSVNVTLYQSLPKGDKFDWIIQKSVELGVTRIAPFISSRTVSRPDLKSASKKLTRWKKISEEAAKQCGRAIIPAVLPLKSFDETLNNSDEPFKLFFYEGGGVSVKKALTASEPPVKDIAIMIGPEGGFENFEADQASQFGFLKTSLGKRILRTETAPLVALSIIMSHTGNLE